MEEFEMPQELASSTLASLVRENLQIIRSHENMDTLRFSNMDSKFEDIKSLIRDTNLKIDNMRKGYDNKFWTLAISIIFTLLSAISALVYRIIITKG